MKKFLFIVTFLSLCLCGGDSYAQSAFAGYGHQPWLYRSVTYKNPANTTKLASLDTLVDADSGFFQFTSPNKYNMVIDLNMARISGTQAGTAVLMGSTASTMPAPTASSWKVITGSVVYCAGCIGASATVTGTGTTNYQWHLPYDANDFNNYQIRVITSGTVTTTYSGTVGYKN